jgi:iron complex transport system ATP-binding protein
MTSSSSILRFEDVSIEYDQKRVLDHFTCDINEGEFVSLIGPNGSGKSTLINSFLDIVPLKSGRIYLCNIDNTTYSAKKRSQVAAVVPQYFTTSFAFTVRDIVMMGRHPYLKRFQSESTRDLDIVDDAMRLTDVYRLRDRKITELSGGERQRVVISAALAQTPRVLILDEPTNHLDLHHNLEIMQLIKELNENSGLTILAVLHDINAASRYSDRIVLLHDGVLVKDGTVDEVISEEILSPVYQIELVVRHNQLTNAPEIVPLRRKREAVSLVNKKVHVVCGGGSGEYLLEELHSHGYQISCGVVNISDNDAVFALSLGIEVVVEKPYSPISEAKFKENLVLMGESSMVILSEVPFGSGNLSNLTAIETVAREKQVPVYLIECDIDRDFVGGKADEILSRMLEEKLATLISREDALALIKNAKL